MTQHVTIALTTEIEIGMVRQVHYRILIGGRPVIQLQLVVFSNGVCHDGRQVSRIAFFSVLTEVSQLESLCVGLSRLPDDFIESSQPSVQMIWTVVLSQFVFRSVQREPGAADAIAVASNQSAEVGRGRNGLIAIE